MRRWVLAGVGLLAAVVVVTGLARLRLATNILDLLPSDLPGIAALRLWDAHFSGATELRLTVSGEDPASVERVARGLALGLRERRDLVAGAHWQPIWREDPRHGAELVAWKWLQGAPERIEDLAQRLNPENLEAALAGVRERLQFSVSPDEIARLAYDPLGLADSLGDSSGAALSQLGGPAGEGMFVSADGSFRVITVQAAGRMDGFAAAGVWLREVESAVSRLRAAMPESADLAVKITGGPAIAAETARSMERDMRGSVLGTAVVVACLFGWAHRRWAPLLWLLGLLSAVLGITLGLAGWMVEPLSVVSLGFAAILLGMAVDYGLVLHQEAESRLGRAGGVQGRGVLRAVRRSQVRPILFSAGTSAAAFGVLGLAGVPGLAQLGWLTAVGTMVAAAVFLLAYLQPFLWPTPKPGLPGASDRAGGPAESVPGPERGPGRPGKGWGWGTAWVLILAGLAMLWRPPKFEASAKALGPVNSRSQAALEEIQDRLGVQSGGLLLVFDLEAGARGWAKVQAVRGRLEAWREAGRVTGYRLPDALWPHPEHWDRTRAVAGRIADRRDEMVEALRRAGFTGAAVSLAADVFEAWRGLQAEEDLARPRGMTGSWVWDQVFAEESGRVYALGTVQPAAGVAVADLVRDVEALGLARAGSWEALGPLLREFAVRRVLPLGGLALVLVCVALAWAFRSVRGAGLGLATLVFSGALLGGVMAVAGWKWNLMNLLAVPLVLGVGVDYAIHQVLSLSRHGGDRSAVRRTTGRALWLCGGSTMAGFGSMAFSSHAGLASLGQVCAAGIGSVLVTSQWLLPGWWAAFHPLAAAGKDGDAPGVTGPRRGGHGRAASRLYGARLWTAGVALARWLPDGLLRPLARVAARLYALVQRERRRVVERNLEPVVGPRAASEAWALFEEFAEKLIDVWRFEGGVLRGGIFREMRGREHLEAARQGGRGVLLVTLHLGNWELGAVALGGVGRRLLVVTQAEPGARFTESRGAARRAIGVDTLVVGGDALGAIEVVRRLRDGGWVALLMDRPAAATAVPVELFGRRILVSRAPSELARATGCLILPAVVVRIGDGYRAEVLAPVEYDRRDLGSAADRERFAGEILRVFEPSLRQHARQWFHFVDIWEPSGNAR